MTLRRWLTAPATVPAATAWMLADLGEFRGRQDLYVRQAPQPLRILREHALVEPAAMREMIDLWQRMIDEQPVHSLVAVAASNLDFLCIHPFRDGNGRVSRLLLLLQLYKLGYQVGRYISLERLIEEHKERYYETLEQSSRGWHASSHDPWPYVNFVLFVLRRAYRDFEERLGQVAEPRGAKTEAVETAIAKLREPFSVADLQRACPAVSIDLIRRTLKRLRAGGRVECLGRGQQARWRRRGR
jgi:hypothetical protein